MTDVEAIDQAIVWLTRDMEKCMGEGCEQSFVDLEKTIKKLQEIKKRLPAQN